MQPIQQLTTLSGQIEAYVKQAKQDGKTEEQALNGVFLRCVIKGDNHEFTLVKKSIWNRIVIFFSSSETKAQYDFVKNISEVCKLLNNVPDKEGLELEPLETRLNTIIDHVVKNSSKIVAPLTFTASFKEKVSLVQQEEQKVQFAKQQEEEKQKVAQKLAKEQQEQQELQQKIENERIEQKQKQIQERNQQVKPELSAFVGVLKEVLGIDFPVLWTDSNRDMISDVTGALKEKHKSLDERLNALKTTPKWLGIASDPTIFGRDGTPQAALLLSLRNDLSKQIDPLVMNIQNPTVWKQSLANARKTLESINYLLIAHGEDNHTEYKTAKRVEAFLILEQLFSELKNLEPTFRLESSHILLLYAKNLEPFYREDTVGLQHVVAIDEGAMIKLLGNVRAGARSAQAGFAEDSTSPIKKLIDGYVEFANTYLPY